MTMWERITRGVSQVFDRETQRTPREGGLASLSDRLGLNQLSDLQLGAELERRRRARGASASRRPAGDEELEAIHQARRARNREQPLSRAYASLELPLTASRREVELAFRKLLRSYHPDRHIGDPEMHKQAIALATSLVDAYLAILQNTDRR